jgi:hypothetical protein
MGITTAMCTSFKSELLGGVHDLDTHTIKLALIKASPSGTYDATTTNYSDITGNSDEASGTNYPSGGQQLDSAVITALGTTATVDFADVENSGTTFTANISASSVDIVVHSLGYEYQKIEGADTSSNLTLPIQQRVDRNYRNP